MNVPAGVRDDVLDDRERQTVAAMTAVGEPVDQVHLDVTRRRTGPRPSTSPSAEFGKLDVLVNNASVFIGKGIEK